MAEAELVRGDGVAAEIWRGYRPYFVQLCVDFLISTSMWIVLFLFKTVTQLLSVDGWAADIILVVHSAGTVSAFAVFATLFVLDVIAIHRQKHAAETHG